MPSLDTTNWILGVMAATSAAQFLMLVVGAIWVVAPHRQSSTTRLPTTITRFEANHLPELSTRVSGLVDDLHRVAERARPRRRGSGARHARRAGRA